MRNFIALAGAILTALSVSGAALANTVDSIVVRIGDHDWKVTTITDSYNNIEADSTLPNLTDQIWWGDIALAAEFTNAVSFTLGDPNSDSNFNGKIGPFFAFGIEVVAGMEWVDALKCDTFSGNVDGQCDDTSAISRSIVQQSATDVTFAVAEKVNPIPLPAGLPLVLTGLAGFAGLRMRKTRIARI